MRKPASTHVRYGYRRLTVLLRREGWNVNANRVYRFYDEENLKVRSVERKKISRRQRVAQPQAAQPNQCWSADFVSDKLADGCTIRILTVIDQFTRECVWLEADRSMNGAKVAAALTRAAAERGQAPRSITLDNGTEFVNKAMEVWAPQTGVQLCGAAVFPPDPSGCDTAACSRTASPGAPNGARRGHVSAAPTSPGETSGEASELF